MPKSFWEKHKKKLITSFFTSSVSSFIIIVLLIILVAQMMFGFMVGAENQRNKNSNSTTGSGKLCDQVKTDKQLYLNEINKYDNLKNISNFILAQVCQESGGNGNDPMQASESKCGSIGCITSKQESIEYGIKHLSEIMQKIKDKGLKETPATLFQTYNFGTGYIYWLVKNNLSESTKESAEKYSTEMCGQGGTSKGTAVNDNKDACYGDYLYFDHMKRYIEGVSKLAKIYKDRERITLTQKYGWTNFAKSGAYNGQPHNGIDLSIASSEAAPTIYSPVDGKIVSTGWEPGWGNNVVIESNGLYYRFAHLEPIIATTQDAEIKIGDQIGIEGQSGNSKGRHLHFSIYKDSSWNLYNEINTLDPEEYISDLYDIDPAAY